MCKSYSKPKIKFLKPELAIGYEGNLLTYFIKIYNEIPTGWLKDTCKRDTAIGCKAKVEFRIADKLLANTTWWDSELGEIIYPDSQVHKFPLVSVKGEINKPREEDVIFLEGTGASTISSIPPLKIPLNSHIIAEVSIISPSLKKPIINKFDIAITPSYFCPVDVKPFGITQ
jgi:hypothetical protein